MRAVYIIPIIIWILQIEKLYLVKVRKCGDEEDEEDGAPGAA